MLKKKSSKQNSSTKAKLTWHSLYSSVSWLKNERGQVKYTEGSAVKGEKEEMERFLL